MENNGESVACTLGHLISLLVDGGDQAVVYRVIEDEEPDEYGKFVRTIEVTLIPNGHVRRLAAKSDKIHKTLIGLLKAKLLK